METQATPTPTPLAAYLAQHNTPCPACGYNLRGLAGSSCPECQQTLTLSVSLEQSVTRLWLLAILPTWILGAGTALGLLLMATFFNYYFQLLVENSHPLRDMRRESLLLFVYPMLVVIVFLPTAILLTRARGRRWFVTHPRRRALGWSSLIAALLVVGVWLCLPLMMD